MVEVIKNKKNYTFAVCAFIVLNVALGLFYQEVVEILVAGLAVL